MKKIISVAFCLLIASLSLSSCGKKESEDAAGMQAEKESVKVLVAFFSYGGNTRKLAETAAQYTGGDLFRIETEKSYSEDYDKCLEETAREMEENARPALSSHVENMEAYDVVLLGYPIWWGCMPMAVNTFLEEYDFEGKIIAPFCTHGGSGLGSSEQDLKKLCPNAETFEGLAVYGSRADQAGEEMADWLEGLGLYGENQDREEEIQD
ncbi:flavodoxin [Blautia marasmi]|uniref:flavodoxin n=1 Tax=Blautia marasmi TaxID=1917868 RepID=UPI003510FDB6